MISISAQQIVVNWIEYAGAGAVVLMAARIGLGRLRQPADRTSRAAILSCGA